MEKLANYPSLSSCLYNIRPLLRLPLLNQSLLYHPPLTILPIRSTGGPIVELSFKLVLRKKLYSQLAL